MARDPDQLAARIAARQVGLITWCQALITAGLTERQIRWRISSKRWRQVQRGVYAIGGSKGSWEQTLLASQLAARTERPVLRRGKQHLESLEDAVVAGRSALWLRGCKRLGKPEIHELLVNRRRTPTVKGATVRRTDTLPSTDVESVDGIPTLAVPRFLVDLCGRVPDVDFVAVLDDLLATRGRELQAEVHARALELRRGRRAISRLVQLTAPGAAQAFRSWLERHVADAFNAASLPPATWNLELRDNAGGMIGIGDAVWVEQRVVVELDGLGFHRTPDQQRRDRRKDRRLSTAGWLVLRYSWLDVVEGPEEVVAEVRAALRSRTTAAV